MRCCVQVPPLDRRVRVQARVQRGALPPALPGLHLGPGLRQALRLPEHGTLRPGGRPVLLQPGLAGGPLRPELQEGANSTDHPSVLILWKIQPKIVPKQLLEFVGMFSV